jgi:hypothetical protein
MRNDMRTGVRAGLLAGALLALASPVFAQTGTNSGTPKADETDVQKMQRNDQMKSGSGTMAPSATTGAGVNAGTTGTDSGTKTLDDADMAKKRHMNPGATTAPAGR